MTVQETSLQRIQVALEKSMTKPVESHIVLSQINTLRYQRKDKGGQM